VLVNTDDAANATTPPVFRYSTIYQKFNAPTTNAFSSRYVSIEYSNVYNVVNTITPAPATPDADTDVKVSIRASYFHDFVFAAGSVTGNTETSNATTVAGNKVNGIYATQPWTHCHAIIVTVGLTTGVTVTGSNIVALWSRDKAISMMPLPYDNNSDIVTKNLSVVHLAGGRDLIFNDNWFDGGESCIYNPDTTVTASFRRNRFGRRMDKPLGLTGTTPTDDAKYYAIYAGTGLQIYETDTANRNEWEDTGNAVHRVVTVAAPTPAAADPVPVPQSDSTSVPWRGHVSFSSLATGNVLQSVERKVTTGHVFATQKTDESNGIETTVITRLNLSGTKLDTMILRYAGHGTAIDVELINGAEYIWLNWRRTSASAGDTYDIVRFPYRPGTYSTRGAVPGMQGEDSRQRRVPPGVVQLGRQLRRSRHNVVGREPAVPAAPRQQPEERHARPPERENHHDWRRGRAAHNAGLHHLEGLLLPLPRPRWHEQQQRRSAADSEILVEQRGIAPDHRRVAGELPASRRLCRAGGDVNERQHPDLRADQWRGGQPALGLLDNPSGA
jgi:hypothetical protein